MSEQALGGFLVLRECPDSPEERYVGCEAAFWTSWEAMGPALLGYLRCIALGHRPGTRRVYDQRSPAGNQPFVVRGIVPRRHVGGQERDQLPVKFQRLPHLVGLDGEIAVGIDQLRAE